MANKYLKLLAQSERETVDKRFGRNKAVGGTKDYEEYQKNKNQNAQAQKRQHQNENFKKQRAAQEAQVKKNQYQMDIETISNANKGQTPKAVGPVSTFKKINSSTTSLTTRDRNIQTKNVSESIKNQADYNRAKVSVNKYERENRYAPEVIANKSQKENTSFQDAVSAQNDLRSLVSKRQQLQSKMAIYKRTKDWDNYNKTYAQSIELTKKISMAQDNDKYYSSKNTLSNVSGNASDFTSNKLYTDSDYKSDKTFVSNFEKGLNIHNRTDYQNGKPQYDAAKERIKQYENPNMSEQKENYLDIKQKNDVTRSAINTVLSDLKGKSKKINEKMKTDNSLETQDEYNKVLKQIAVEQNRFKKDYNTDYYAEKDAKTKYDKVSKFENIENNSDFASSVQKGKNSKVDSTQFEVRFGKGSNSQIGKDIASYMTNQEYRDKIVSARGLDENGREDISGDVFDKITYFTQDEKDKIYYYIGKKDYKSVGEMYQSMESALNKRRNGYVEAQKYQDYQNNKGYSLVDTMLSNYVGGIAGSAAVLGQEAKNKAAQLVGSDYYENLDPYSDFMAPTRNAQLAQQSLTDEIKNPIQKGIADTMINVGQNVVNTALSGGNEALSLATMGMTAGSARAKELAEKGTPMDRVFLDSSINNAAEIVTEKLPFEQVMDMLKTRDAHTVKGVVTSLLKQAGVEFAEEASSAYIDTVADMVINGKDSEYQQYKQSLIDSGMSEEEASRKANANYFLKDPAYQGAQGALSGLIMAGGAMGINGGMKAANTGLNNIDAAIEGKKIKAGGIDSVNEVLNIAMEADPSTSVYQTAAKITTDLQDGMDVSQISNKEIGSLSLAGKYMGGQFAARDEQKKAQSGQYGYLNEQNYQNIAPKVSSQNLVDNRQDESLNSQNNSVQNNVLPSNVIPITQNNVANANNVPSTAPITQNVPVYTQSENVNKPSLNSFYRNIENGKQMAYIYETEKGDHYMPTIKNLMQNVDENGVKAFNKSYDDSMSFTDNANDFIRYYVAGKQNMDYQKAMEVNEDYTSGNKAIALAAFSAGANDASASLSSDIVISQNETKNAYAGISKEYKNMVSQNEYNVLKKSGKAMGVDIVIKKELGSNGYYDPTTKTIYLGLNADNKVLDTLKHEITHRMRTVSPNEYRAFSDYVMKTLAEKGQDTSKMIADKQALYKSQANQDLSIDDATEEVVADFAKELFQNEKEFGKLAKAHRSVAQKIVDILHDFIAKVKATFGSKNAQDKAAMNEYGVSMAELEKAEALWKNALDATKESVKGMSVNENQDSKQKRYYINENFATDIDNWDRKSKETFYIGTTSDALKSIGVDDRKIKIHSGKINKILKEHSEMNIDVIKKIPNVLENPIIILKSLAKNEYNNNTTSRLVVFGEIFDDKGNPVTCILELRPTTSRGGEVINLNVVASSYARKGFKNFLSRSDVMYLDKNKKRTNTWLQSVGVQFPADANMYGSIGRITYDKGIVNISGSSSEKIFPDIKSSNTYDMQSAEENTNEKRYSIEENSKGKYVKADRQVIHSDDDSIRTNEIMNYVKKKVMNGSDITILLDDGEKISITGRTAWKLGDKGKYNDKYYLVKGNAAGVIDEVLQVSELKRHKPAKKDHSNDFGINGFDYRKAYFMDLDKKYYEMWISVGVNEDGKEAYNIGKIKEIAFPEKSVSGSKAQKGKLSLDTNIHQNESGVNTNSMQNVQKHSDIRYSLKKLPTGEEYVETDNNLFLNEDGSEMTPREAYNTLVGKEFALDDGSKVEIVKRLPGGKDMYSELFRRFPRNKGISNIKSVNDTINKNIEEIIDNSAFIKIDNDNNRKHYKQGIVDFDTREVVFYDSNEAFRLELSIADLQDGRKIAYAKKYLERDIDFEQKIKTEEARSSNSPLNQPSNDNIHQNESGVNTYDMQNVQKHSEKSAEQLQRSNAKLSQKIQYLKEETKQTHGKVIDPKNAAKIANELIATYGKNIVKDDLIADFNRLYNNLKSKKFDAIKFRNTLDSISHNIVDNAMVKDDILHNQYADLLDRMRTTAVYVAEGDRVDDYNDFRKHNFGRLKLTSNQSNVGVDQFYMELSDEYPDLFPDEIYNVQDELIRLSEVAKQMQISYENPFSADMENAYVEMAADVLDLISNADSRVTFADKQKELRNNAVTKEKGKANERLEKQKGNYQERLEKEREKSQKKLTRLLNKEKERRENQVESLKTSYKAREESRKDRQTVSGLREKIKHHAHRISTMLLRPNENSHVPKEMRTDIADLMSSIDFTTDRQGYNTVQALDRLKKQYEALVGRKDGGLYEIDPDLADNIEEVKSALYEKRIIDLNVAELDKLYRVLWAVRKSISSYNRMLSDKKAEGIAQIGEAIIDDNLTEKGRNPNKVFKKLDDLINVHYLNPEDYFSRMGNAALGVYKKLRKGFDKKINYISQSEEFMKSVLEKHKVKDVEQFSKQVHDITLESGESLKMSTAQIMSLYELAKREQAKKHIYVGGIKPVDIKGKIKDIRQFDNVQVNETDVANITSKLSAEEKALADDMAAYFKETANWGNETSVAMYGYEKFTEENYFPIRTNADYLNSDPMNARDSSIKSMGVTKQTIPNAQNPVLIEGFFDVFSRQVDNMSSYGAFVLPLADMNRIFNYKGSNRGSIREVVRKKFGDEFLKYYDNFLIDVNGRNQNSQGDELYKGWVSRFKAAAVGGNLRVIVQQPTAIMRAAAMINPIYLAQSAGSMQGFNRAAYKRMIENAPIAKWKAYGYFDTNIGPRLSDVLYGKKHFTDAMMSGAELADNMTWSSIWRAVELEQKHKRKDLVYKSDDFYKACGERFSEIVDRTQVVDSVFHRSQIMRSKNMLVQIANAFMSEPLKSYNMLYTAATDAKNKRGTKAHFARTVFAFGTSIILNSVVCAAMDMIRKKDDDEEKFKDKFNGNLIDNLISIVPLLSNVSSALQGYDFKRIDMQWLSECANAVVELQENISAILNGEEPKTTWFKIAKDAIKGISYLSGIPAYNIERDLESICRTVFKQTGNKYAEYEMLKLFNNIKNDKKQGVFKQFIYDLSKGYDEEVYNKIIDDAVANGLDERKLYSYMRSRDLKNGSDITKYDNEKAKNVIDYSKINDFVDYEKAASSSDGEEFNADTYGRFNDARNSAVAQILDELRNNTFYLDMTDEMKDEANKKALSYASKKTAHDYGQEYKKADAWIEKAQDAASDTGMSETDYILYQIALKMNDADGNGTIDKTETQIALDSMGLDKDTKTYLYGQKYKTAKTNPYTAGDSLGLTVDEYRSYSEALKNSDADGNGSYKKEEVIAALDSLDMPNSTKAKIFDSKYKKGNPYR